MSKRGYVKTAPDASLAPCYPAHRSNACMVCVRRKDGEPPHDRRFVVIDASTVLQYGVCGMFSARPAVRAYAEVV